MTDEAYLMYINKVASSVKEFKETINTLKEGWVKATGYAAPFGVMEFNASSRRIINDLEAEAEDVESFIEVAAAGKQEVM